MKINKKNPRKQLEKFSTIFMQLGLVLALFVTYITIEQKTETVEMISMAEPAEEPVIVMDDKSIVFRKEIPVKPKVKMPAEIKPKVQSVDMSKITKQKIVDKATEAVVSEPIENPEPKIVAPSQIQEIDIEEEPEEVPFAVIEEVPLFPGCNAGAKREEKRKCLEKKMRRYAAKNFDIDMASNLGLKSGKHRIMVVFKIDKSGNVSDIKASAPHPELKKEVERIIKKLPKMQPGKQRNKPVAVKYVLPFGFRID